MCGMDGGSNPPDAATLRILMLQSTLHDKFYFYSAKK